MAPKFISQASLAEQLPRAQFAPHVDLRKELKIVRETDLDDGSKGTIVEFIGAKDFPNEFRTVQQYEIDAGRTEHPLLYLPIYSVTENPDLPEYVPIYRYGPYGVTFEEINEGGEVKFMTVGTSQTSTQIRQYAVGLEYSKRMVMYNYLWQVGQPEREVGRSFNALLNHIHLGPILTYAYGASNQTAAQTGQGSLELNYLRTLEKAITDGEDDTTNPRRGPFILLIANNNRFTWQRALTEVAQEGYEKLGDAASEIDTVIVYSGGTFTRGKVSTTYSGVTTNKAYLISTEYKNVDFQSFVKQGLQSTVDNGDITRFILERQVWDSFFGIFANPVRAVQEITLPTSAS